MTAWMKVMTAKLSLLKKYLGFNLIKKNNKKTGL
jgi:hypothetical protein